MQNSSRTSSSLAIVGAEVAVQYETGKRVTILLCKPGTSRPGVQYGVDALVGVDAPLGRAVLGATVGDTRKFRAGRFQHEVRIEAIRPTAPMKRVRRSTRRGRVMAAIAATLLLALSLGACGTADPSSVSLAVRIDASSSSLDPQVRGSYVNAAMSRAGEFFDTGGTLAELEVFAGSPHGVPLLTDRELSPGLSDVQRAREVVPLRADLQQGLEEALGVARARPEIAEAVKSLAPGTDVAGNLAGAVESVRGAANGQVVLLTDGRDSRFPRNASAQEMLAAIRPLLPTDAEGITVSILGVGGTRNGGATAEDTALLLDVWAQACKQTGADCAVSADVEINSLSN